MVTTWLASMSRGAGGDDLEAGQVELHEASGRRGRREELAGVAEGRGRRRPDEALEAEHATVAQVDDGLVDGRQRASPDDVADGRDGTLVGGGVGCLVTIGVVDRHRAAAVALAAIERGIGLAEELAAVDGQEWHGRDAAREGDGALARRWPQAEVAQPVGRHEGVRGLRVGQDDGELVAADAEGAVAVAQGVADAVGHADEEAVAGGMAFAVVDDLEVVEVDEQQRDRHLVASVELQLAVQLLLEGAMVAEAGETVVQRVLAGLAVEHLELRLRPGQVVEGLQEASGRRRRRRAGRGGRSPRAQPRAGSSRASGTTGQTWMSPKRVPSPACQSGAAVLTQPDEASARAVPAWPDVMPLMWTRRSPSGRVPGPPAPAADAVGPRSRHDGVRGQVHERGTAGGAGGTGREVEETSQADLGSQDAGLAPCRAGEPGREREVAGAVVGPAGVLDDAAGGRSQGRRGQAG